MIRKLLRWVNAMTSNYGPVTVDHDKKILIAAGKVYDLVGGKDSPLVVIGERAMPLKKFTALYEAGLDPELFA